MADLVKIRNTRLHAVAFVSEIRTSVLAIGPSLTQSSCGAAVELARPTLNGADTRPSLSLGRINTSSSQASLFRSPAMAPRRKEVEMFRAGSAIPIPDLDTACWKWHPMDHGSTLPFVNFTPRRRPWSRSPASSEEQHLRFGKPECLGTY